jgi:hypothetical protein
VAVNQATRHGFATAIGVLAALVAWQVLSAKFPQIKTSFA